jgi:hypothetical protein
MTLSLVPAIMFMMASGNSSLISEKLSIPGRTISSITLVDIGGKNYTFILIQSLKKSYFVSESLREKSVDFNGRQFKFEEVGTADNFPFTWPTVKEFKKISGVLGSDFLEKFSIEIDQRTQKIAVLTEEEVEQRLSKVSGDIYGPRLRINTREAVRDTRLVLERSNFPIEVEIGLPYGYLRPFRGFNLGGCVMNENGELNFPTIFTTEADKEKIESKGALNFPYHRILWYSKYKAVLLLDHVKSPLTSLLRSVYSFEVDEKGPTIKLELKVDDAANNEWVALQKINDLTVVEMKEMLKRRAFKKLGEFLLKSVRNGLVLTVNRNVNDELIETRLEYEALPNYYMGSK